MGHRSPHLPAHGAAEQLLHLEDRGDGLPDEPDGGPSVAATASGDLPALDPPPVVLAPGDLLDVALQVPPADLVPDADHGALDHRGEGFGVVDVRLVAWAGVFVGAVVHRMVGFELLGDALVDRGAVGHQPRVQVAPARQEFLRDVRVRP
ncbi:hypothetical protein AY600_08745 [Phormidium willei BDU 130791]|nr:hypothetical protein AY600_08745 [Phormidium willei BDU 130791]